jgi:single-stranded-DNA-specific exonuclease
MSDFIEEMINNAPEWIYRGIDDNAIENFSQISGFTRRVSKTLLLRGIGTKEDLEQYLHDDLYSLKNPFLFSSMLETVGRVKKAIHGGERIFIFGDRDADGVLSTSMLYNMLKRFDATVVYRVPGGDYGYGIEKNDIDFANSEDVSLIITVDTGISSAEEIKYARSLGMETIIMDHHIQPENIPEAFSILNPKMDNENYPFKDLSAGGVVLKFIHAFILSYTKNFNRLFIPVVSDGEMIEGVKVRNGLAIERVKFHESIHYPIGNNATIVIDTDKPLPEYFKSWLKDSKINQLSIITSQEYSTVDDFTDIFIRIFLKKQKKCMEFVRSYVDLSALSTISDIMPFVDENRIIVKEGLRQIGNSGNLGLRILLGYCNLPDRELTARDIAWNLSPIINSAGRMGDADIAVRLFTTNDLNAANELSKMLIQFNEQRREKGERNLSIIKPIIEDIYYKDPVIVLSTDEAEHGVTGIIASKISKKYSKPVFIIVNDGDFGIGSGRAGESIDLIALVSRCEDLLVKYGGHKSAVGFTIDTNNIDKFRKRMHAIAIKDSDLFGDQETLEIDDSISPEEITFKLLGDLRIFEPTGPGNLPPCFSILGTTFINPARIGKDKNHVKFMIPTTVGMIPVIGWGMADKGFRILDSNELVDIVFSIEDNYFRGERLLQLILIDIRGSEENIRGNNR